MCQELRGAVCTVEMPKRSSDMTIWKTLLVASFLCLVACDKKDAPIEPPLGGSITPANFAAQLTDATCEWRATCKNEEVVHFLQINHRLSLLNVMLYHPDMRDEIQAAQALFEKREREHRLLLTPEECARVGAIHMAATRVDATTLEESVEQGRVVFDAHEASSCLTKTRQRDTMCEREIKIDLSKQLDFDALQNQYKASIKRRSEFCKDVLIGQLDIGDPCVASYECPSDATCDNVCIHRAEPSHDTHDHSGSTGGHP